MVQGQVLLKWGLALFLLIFSRFIIFTFRNYLLQNCVMHLDFFFMSPEFSEKIHFKWSENEPENIP